MRSKGISERPGGVERELGGDALLLIGKRVPDWEAWDLVGGGRADVRIIK